MEVEEFVKRLKRLLSSEGMAAFFLGAGASISSGIPGAGALSKEWVKELYSVQRHTGEAFDDWRARCCEVYDDSRPATAYTALMQQLFPMPSERQREIERVVGGRDPGFAYATLAQLLATEGIGQRCNIVLTTNFDDLVADALYLYTRSRPLVVTHGSLVQYAAVGRSRPTVIKLHGDAMLRPLNTDDELATLAQEYLDALGQHLQSRALVVIGYGGNDVGVFEAIKALPANTISHGIYWVSDVLPDNAFGKWLRTRSDVFHVKHLDFDELMAVVKTEFDLPNPDERRFNDLMARYRDTFTALQSKVRERDDESSVVARSVEEVRKQFDSWFSVELEAEKFKASDPERAEQTYQAGLEAFPRSAELLGNYANFLTDVRHDHDRAEQLYDAAITTDPSDATHLGNYAVFVTDVRHDYDRAQQLYDAAITADPNDANNLGNYALFLTDVRHDHDRAQQLYDAAITANPNNANCLGNYALFLTNIRHDHDRAQQLYDAAITANPNSANCLGNYANFFTNIRHDHDHAQQLYDAAITANPDHANNLSNYALFLTNIRHDHDCAQQLYDAAITANPNNATNLSNYALFLTDVRHDHDRAQQLYDAAITADPNNANVLGNYALFLTNVRRDHDRAQQLYDAAITADPHNANHLGNYANFLTSVRHDHDRAQQLYDATIAADPDNANVLGNYAVLLETVRHDYDRAQQLYDAAITANPNHANNLGNYAVFLTDVRHDHDRAGQLYDAAITANPNNVTNLGNYVRVLFASGRETAARELCSRVRALDQFNDATHRGLRLEVGFYELANDAELPPDSWTHLLGELVHELRAGVRSTGWSFDINLDRAEAMGASPERMALLRALAGVISDELPIKALDPYAP